VRSCEKLPLYLIKPGSKMDPPLAKAKPISDCGSDSVINIFNKEKKKKTALRQQPTEMSETTWEKQLCRHQGQ